MLLAAIALAPPAQAAFPGANGLIAVSRTSPKPAQVWLVHPSTGRPALVGEPLAQPAWSPDGQKLALTEGYTGTSIDIRDLRGNSYPHSTCQVIGGRTYGHSSSWAPDGRRFVFACQSSNGAILVGKLGSESGYATPLTQDGNNPAWSPDGTTIAFDRPDGIWLMNNDGTHQRRLIDLPGVYEERPDWSPDGEQLAFTADSEPPPGGCCAAGNVDVYAISADGGQLKRLTYSAGADSGPAFSPDGRRIAFVSHRPGHGELYLMNRNGTHQTRLTYSPPRVITPPPERPTYDSYFDPDWQPLPKKHPRCLDPGATVRFTNPHCKRTIPGGWRVP